jgi:hypothetical protein
MDKLSYGQTDQGIIWTYGDRPNSLIPSASDVTMMMMMISARAHNCS